MNNYCVVVADGARARFFLLESEKTAAKGGPNLVEKNGLVNAEAELAGKDLFSDNKSGRNISSGGGGAHGYDDHRDRQIEEHERRFAKQIAETALRVAGEQKSKHLVLVADKRMLGHLRGAMTVPPTTGLEVSEVAKNLTKLAPQELHEHLAGEQLLPRRHGI